MAQVKKEKGISLFIVMIIVLLTAIIVAIGFRASVLNEAVTGNAAEYQRVYEAAQALAHEAELDIMQSTASGGRCTGTRCRAYKGAVISDDYPNGRMYYPKGDSLTEVQASLMSATPVECIAGICNPILRADAGGGNVPYDFWNFPELNNYKLRAARYGQYTGDFNESGQRRNPRLNPNNAWYWVEILPYKSETAVFDGTGLAPSDMDAIYRITALVEGLKNTRVVIQKIVVGKSSAQ